MILLKTEFPDKLAAYTAAFMAAIALLDRIVQYYVKKKKDSRQLEEAYDKAPQVRQQLEIGNFRGAIEGMLLVQKEQREAYLERETQRDRREEELGLEIHRLENVVADQREEIVSLRADKEEANRRISYLEDHIRRLENGTKDKTL